MSEKQKEQVTEMVKKITALPEPLRQRILDKADGAMMAMDAMQQAEGKKDVAESG